MQFWDSSGIVPLLVAEPGSDAMRRALVQDSSMALWWATPVECTSALWRRRRAGQLDDLGLQQALEDLAALALHSEFVQPGDAVRQRAIRLLAVHALGAADAMQLSAALLRTHERPAGIGFVTLDDRLREAARREGFTVLPGDGA